MEKDIDMFIVGKGMVKCVTSRKEIYYLDIETHNFYTIKEMEKMMKEANGNV